MSDTSCRCLILRVADTQYQTPTRSIRHGFRSRPPVLCTQAARRSAIIGTRMPNRVVASSSEATPVSSPSRSDASSVPPSPPPSAAARSLEAGGDGGGAGDAVLPHADNWVLPANGSLYWDYLSTYQLDVIEVSLPEPQDDDDLFEDPEDALVAPDFVLEKVARDEWKNLPGHEGVVSTACVFEYILARMRGKKDIVVTYGKDPRKIKRELAGSLSAGPRWFSIATVIDLEEEHEAAAQGSAEKLCSATGVALFEKVGRLPPPP